MNGLPAAVNGGTAGRARAMTSAVNWVVLGLLIERPSYGLELYHRYQRRYADVLPVSGESHVYAALDALKIRGLVEVISADASVRQPKPHYRATSLGVRSFEDWLVKQIPDELRRQELWVRQLAIFDHDPSAALRVLARVESECLAGAGSIGLGQTPWVAASSRDRLIDELISERRRVAVGETLTWLRHVIARFKERARSGTDVPA